ncbi:archaemetzincin-2 isoform X3 [Anolis carolinensis]|uniref:archaemetzincin-2 isoform X3 n=1 Tax=Anolis carolinensis TaxID=28377 RepID=UPI002F2B26A0
MADFLPSRSSLSVCFPSCLLNSSEAEQQRKSKEIDKCLYREKTYVKRLVKILLLGAGESGKSTFLKQMRIIHGEDWDRSAREDFRATIYSNVLKGVRVLVDAREKLHIPWGNPANQTNGDKLMAFDTRSGVAVQGMVETEVFLQYLPAIRSLWTDSGIQHAYDRRREFQLMKVIKHSEEALKLALISKDKKLVKLYENLEPKEKLLLSQAFQPGSVLFKTITLHSESDWISSHPEPTQDFAQFYHDPHRNTPSPQKNRIYVQPIGSFGDSRISTDVYMQWLKDYCEAFYYGLTVRILGPVPVSHTGCAFRINEYTHNLQIHAGHLLNYLKKKKAKDAFCIVGVTMIDLYPKDSWNFVFGQASLTEDG